MGHRRPKPLRNPSQSFVMTSIAVICLGMLLWAVGTVLAWLMGWAS